MSTTDRYRLDQPNGRTRRSPLKCWQTADEWLENIFFVFALFGALFSLFFMVYSGLKADSGTLWLLTMFAYGCFGLAVLAVPGVIVAKVKVCRLKRPGATPA